MNEKSSDPTALRSQLNQTQEEFARLLGISYATVSRWENNHAKPIGLQKLMLDLLTRALDAKSHKVVIDELFVCKTDEDRIRALTKMTEDSI